jgi:hypothetical protein
MIEYDKYGEPDGCTHRIPAEQMDLMEAAECRQAIAEAAESLGEYLMYIYTQSRVNEELLRIAQADLASAEQLLRIAHGFIGWVLRNAEDGIPAHDLIKRAQRALSGQERYLSKPPRPPLDT